MAIRKMDAVSVTVRSTTGGEECVTTSSFRAWKKRAGRDTAFVLQIPDSDGHFVHTWRDMQTLAPGVYEAELVQKVRLPQKIARGCDAWKCV